MTVRSTSQLVVAAVLAATGLAGAIGGIRYGPLTEEGLVGPGLMPLAAGLIVLIAAATIAVKQFLPESGASVSISDVVGLEDLEADESLLVADDRDEFGRTTTQRGRAVVLIFAAILGMILLVPLIGLLLSLVLLVGVLVGLIERKKGWVALACMAGTFLFGYLVFQVLLGVPMPSGLLGLV